MTRRQVERAVAQGLLERRGPRLLVDPTWDAAGEPESEFRHEIFALLCTCTPCQRESAVVFRRSAAALWGLDAFNPKSAMLPVEIAVTRGRAMAGALFSAGDLPASDVTEVAGFRVTTVVRTLIDLGEVVGADLVERALESALRHRYTTPEELSVALAPGSKLGPRRRGTGALRSLLTARPGGQVPTESDAETLFVQLVRRAGLPPPQRQFVVYTPEGMFRLDFAWPFVRVAVEIDGAAAHASASALTRDLRRQNAVVVALAGAGWILLRFSYADLVDERLIKQTSTKLVEAWTIGMARPH